MTQISELSGLLSTGSAIFFGLLTNLNNDSHTIGAQLINFGTSGSQLLSLGLNALGNSLPSLPTLP